MTGEGAQVVGAVVSFLLLLAVAVAVVLSSRPRVWRNFQHPALSRYTFVALFLMAALRLYSGTSFLWAGSVDPWVLDIFRFTVLATGTVVFVLACTIVAYLWRLYRRRD